ncbi:hypothetical protein ACJJTC_011163 [Scirpophaga incertulas]
MSFFTKIYLCVFLCLLQHFTQCSGLHPTSCTEDSQCSTGLYCEPGVHLCRQCLSCDALQRKAPATGHHECIKAIRECGDCFEGLVQEYEGPNGQCTRPKKVTPHGVLPPYAWAAIAAILLLMLIILCLFARMKTFKFAYASSTSVQSVQATGTVPPPYNYNSSPVPLSPPDVLEMHQLKGSLSSGPSPENETMRPRESSRSQSARVYNNPAYVRLPQNPLSYQTRDTPVANLEESQSRTNGYLLNDGDERLTSIQQEDGNHNTPEDNNLDLSNESPYSTMTVIDPRIEDSNNNSEPNEHASSQRGPNTRYCHNFVSGPSFVINVVENIQNNQ